MPTEPKEEQAKPVEPNKNQPNQDQSKQESKLSNKARRLSNTCIS